MTTARSRSRALDRSLMLRRAVDAWVSTLQKPGGIVTVQSDGRATTIALGGPGAFAASTFRIEDSDLIACLGRRPVGSVHGGRISERGVGPLLPAGIGAMVAAARRAVLGLYRDAWLLQERAA